MLFLTFSLKIHWKPFYFIEWNVGILTLPTIESRILFTGAKAVLSTSDRANKYIRLQGLPIRCF